jgi:hypothetical protein
VSIVRLVNDEQAKDLGRSGCGFIQAFNWSDSEKPRGTSITITGVPPEIRTGYLLNTNLQRYRETIQAGGKVSPVDASVTLF